MSTFIELVLGPCCPLKEREEEDVKTESALQQIQTHTQHRMDDLGETPQLPHHYHFPASTSCCTIRLTSALFRLKPVFYYAKMSKSNDQYVINFPITVNPVP